MRAYYFIDKHLLANLIVMEYFSISIF